MAREPGVLERLEVAIDARESSGPPARGDLLGGHGPLGGEQRLDDQAPRRRDAQPARAQGAERGRATLAGASGARRDGETVMTSPLRFCAAPARPGRPLLAQRPHDRIMRVISPGTGLDGQHAADADDRERGHRGQRGERARGRGPASARRVATTAMPSRGQRRREPEAERDDQHAARARPGAARSRRAGRRAPTGTGSARPSAHRDDAARRRVSVVRRGGGGDGGGARCALRARGAAQHARRRRRPRAARRRGSATDTGPRAARTATARASTTPSANTPAVCVTVTVAPSATACRAVPRVPTR